jgi:lipopolysaccharide export LptBFGC system permease protein LptF
MPGHSVDSVRTLTDGDVERILDECNGVLELHNMEHADDILLERAGVTQAARVNVGGLVDTRKLQVQYHLKFANPLFALIMAMIAAPFGFLVGHRGAMTGIGVSIVIGIAYWGVQPLFEKIGDVGLLPPAMAAWSPDLLFSLMGMYLLLRMKS